MKGSMVVKKNEVEKLLCILDTFSELDDIRWKVQVEVKRNLINYCCDEKDLTADEKLLTHWLCYITDRQTPYQRIWEVGGYVVSHMVRAFCREDSRTVRELFGSYFFQGEDDKLRLKCDFTENEASNARLARYGIKKEAGTADRVEFASRYPSDDLVRMYRTLEILAKHYEKSLALFIATSFRSEDDYRQAIRRMAAALNKLTYAVGTVSVGEFKQGLENMADEAAAFEMPTKVRPGNMFGRKRLWCCVRDYLKSPEFNGVFVDALDALDERRVDTPERWNRDNQEMKHALDVIELPGDVWNNNEAFRDGLFTPYLTDKAKHWDMPKTIRNLYNELYEKDHRLRFYPEQLDVTFDFVPQMCERDMCDVCLFGDGIEEICHQQTGRLCPVALVSCGYRHNCNPEKCSMKENRSKGHCKLHKDARERA